MTLDRRRRGNGFYCWRPPQPLLELLLLIQLLFATSSLANRVARLPQPSLGSPCLLPNRDVVLAGPAGLLVRVPCDEPQQLLSAPDLDAPADPHRTVDAVVGSECYRCVVPRTHTDPRLAGGVDDIAATDGSRNSNVDGVRRGQGGIGGGDLELVVVDEGKMSLPENIVEEDDERGGGGAVAALAAGVAAAVIGAAGLLFADAATVAAEAAALLDVSDKNVNGAEEGFYEDVWSTDNDRRAEEKGTDGVGRRIAETLEPRPDRARAVMRSPTDAQEWSESGSLRRCDGVRAARRWDPRVRDGGAPCSQPGQKGLDASIEEVAPTRADAGPLRGKVERLADAAERWRNGEALGGGIGGSADAGAAAAQSEPSLPQTEGRFTERGRVLQVSTPSPASTSGTTSGTPTVIPSPTPPPTEAPPTGPPVATPTPSPPTPFPTTPSTEAPPTGPPVATPTPIPSPTPPPTEAPPTDPPVATPTPSPRTPFPTTPSTEAPPTDPPVATPTPSPPTPFPTTPQTETPPTGPPVATPTPIPSPTPPPTEAPPTVTLDTPSPLDAPTGAFMASPTRSPMASASPAPVTLDTPSPLDAPTGIITGGPISTTAPPIGTPEPVPVPTSAGTTPSSRAGGTPSPSANSESPVDTVAPITTPTVTSVTPAPSPSGTTPSPRVTEILIETPTPVPTSIRSSPALTPTPVRSSIAPVNSVSPLSTQTPAAETVSPSPASMTMGPLETSMSPVPTTSETTVTLTPMPVGATFPPGFTLPPDNTAAPLSAPNSATATVAPLPAGGTLSPSTTFPPVDTAGPFPAPTIPAVSPAPLSGDTTRNPSTTSAPVDTMAPLPTLSSLAATVAPLPVDLTLSPSVSISPVGTPAPPPTPTFPGASFAPLPTGTTRSPSTNTSPVETAFPIPTPAVEAGTSTPLEPGTTHSPSTTVVPDDIPPQPTSTLPAATVTPSPVDDITRSPSATLTTVDSVAPVPSPTSVAATFPSLPEGTTRSPSSTLPPMDTAAPVSTPTVAAATSDPVEPGTTPSPSVTLPSVDNATPTPTPTIAPLEQGATRSPSTTLSSMPDPTGSPLPSPSPIALVSQSPLNNPLSPGPTLAPGATSTSGATIAPVDPTPAPTPAATNSTLVDEVLGTTGDAAGGAVAVAVASTAAAVTVTAATASTTSTVAVVTSTTTASTATATAASTGAAATSTGAAATSTGAAATSTGAAATSTSAAATSTGAATTGATTAGAASSSGATGAGGVVGGANTAATATAAGESTATATTATTTTTTGSTATTGATGATGASGTATAPGSTAAGGTTTATSTSTTTGGTTATTSGGTTTDPGNVTQQRNLASNPGGGTAGNMTGGMENTAGGAETTTGGAETTTGGAETTTATDGTTQEPNQPITDTTSPATDAGKSSSRSASATLGMLMIFQMQFLSSLRFLEANLSAPFRGLVDKMKWLNLHFDPGLGIWDCQDSDDGRSDNDNMWAFNTFLVFGFLVFLVVCHILIISFMQAAWLSQANAIRRNRVARGEERSRLQRSRPSTESEADGNRLSDESNSDDDLDEQEAKATETFLRAHNSAWLYFPHIELVFLLFAYQGASVAEARMLYSGCPTLVAMGAFALFVFPITMIIYVGSIVWKRVKPQTGPITFHKATPPSDRRCWCIAMCIGFRDGWKDSHSIFEWADKGVWKSRDEGKEDLNGRMFRIGFEPLFVDYTRKGAVYIIFLLFKWFATGITAGLVTNGTVQTSVLASLFLLDAALLVILRPFSNSFIQWVETTLVTADACTLILMVYASLLDGDQDVARLDLIYAICLMIQTFAILFLTIPIYLDTLVILFAQIRDRVGKLWSGKSGEEQAHKETARKEVKIKGSIRETCSLLCPLVRQNVRACARATVFSPTQGVSGIKDMEEEESDTGFEYMEGRMFLSRRKVQPSALPVVKYGRSSARDIESGNGQFLSVEGDPAMMVSAVEGEDSGSGGSDDNGDGGVNAHGPGLTSRQRAVGRGSKGGSVLSKRGLISKRSWRGRQVEASELPVVRFGRASSRQVESWNGQFLSVEGDPEMMVSAVEGEDSGSGGVNAHGPGLTSRQRAVAAGAGAVGRGSMGGSVLSKRGLVLKRSWRGRQVEASALPVVRFGRASSREVESWKGRFASDQDYLLAPDHSTNDTRGGGDTRGFSTPIFSGLSSRQRAAAAGVGMVGGGSSGRGVFLNQSLTSRAGSWRRRRVKASALPIVKFGRSSRDVESGDERFLSDDNDSPIAVKAFQNHPGSGVSSREDRDCESDLIRFDPLNTSGLTTSQLAATGAGAGFVGGASGGIASGGGARRDNATAEGGTFGTAGARAMSKLMLEGNYQGGDGLPDSWPSWGVKRPSTIEEEAMSPSSRVLPPPMVRPPSYDQAMPPFEGGEADHDGGFGVYPGIGAGGGAMARPGAASTGYNSVSKLQSGGYEYEEKYDRGNGGHGGDGGNGVDGRTWSLTPRQTSPATATRTSHLREEKPYTAEILFSTGASSLSWDGGRGRGKGGEGRGGGERDRLRSYSGSDISPVPSSDDNQSLYPRGSEFSDASSWFTKNGPEEPPGLL